MDTKKLPPTLLIALGLVGCGDDGGEVSTSACLSLGSMTSEGTTDATAGSESSSSSDSNSETTFGPCLDAPLSTTSTTDPTGTGTGTGTDTDPDTDTDTDATGTGESDSSGSAGAQDRDDVVRTLLDRGILPHDVATKLGR